MNLLTFHGTVSRCVVRRNHRLPLVHHQFGTHANRTVDLAQLVHRATDTGLLQMLHRHVQQEQLIQTMQQLEIRTCEKTNISDDTACVCFVCCVRACVSVFCVDKLRSSRVIRPLVTVTYNTLRTDTISPSGEPVNAFPTTRIWLEQSTTDIIITMIYAYPCLVIAALFDAALVVCNHFRNGRHCDGSGGWGCRGL